MSAVELDLIIMSKATTPELRAMTQHTIDTAKMGTRHQLNIIVLEQESALYSDALTVENPGPFNYNKACNRGAMMGTAPRIMFANNDLTFTGGWLDSLINARHPVVSPISPGYHRQLNIHDNEVGWEVGRHLAGWCFMMSRWLWNDLGGLDEAYTFWCSDNAVMDQLRAKDVMPMVCRSAVVHHLVSATLTRESRDVQDELTWAELHQYNAEHVNKHLMGDRRYRMWRQRQGLK